MLKENNNPGENYEKIVIDKDNRNLVDKSENQKLSRDDIEKLKSNEEMSGNVSLNSFKVKN